MLTVLINHLDYEQWEASIPYIHGNSDADRSRWTPVVR